MLWWTYNQCIWKSFFFTITPFLGVTKPNWATLVQHQYTLFYEIGSPYRKSADFCPNKWVPCKDGSWSIGNFIKFSLKLTHASGTVPYKYLSGFSSGPAPFSPCLASQLAGWPLNHSIGHEDSILVDEIFILMRTEKALAGGRNRG